MKDNAILKSAIERFDNDIMKLKQNMTASRYDFRDPASVKRFEKHIDEVFDARINAVLGVDNRQDAASQNNCEYLVLKRRRRAIANIAKAAQEKFSEKYPALCIPDEILSFSAPLNMLTFDTLDQQYAVELAASIWMLDYLKAHDVFDEAAECFPRDRDTLSSVYLPNLSDSVHSDDELRSMIYVIRRRNKGAKGYDERRVFCDEADTGLKKDDTVGDLPDRQNFERILSLIKPESVKEAQDSFIERVERFTDDLLALTAERRSELKREEECFFSEYENKKQNFGNLMPDNPLTLRMDNGNTSLLNDHPLNFDRFSDLPATLRAFEKQLDRLQEKEESIDNLYYGITLAPLWLSGGLPDAEEMEVFSGLKTPTIRNPYEMCFAFLSLLDENSDVVWLYNIPFDVLSFACRSLPWADTNVVDPDNALGAMDIDYAYLKDLVEKTPLWDDNHDNEVMYEKLFPSPLISEKRQTISISQLVFLATGLLPPRRVSSIAFTKALLNESSLSEEQKELIYAYIALAYSVNHKDAGYTPLDDGRSEDNSSETADTAEEIKKLRSEIKRLKNAVNQLEHQNKDLTARLSSTVNQLDASNKELAELRSMIREASDSDETSEVSVSFPYAVKKRTVIIGGHASWVKAIRPLLENVRYIGASENPRSGVILNAEVVWIQTNAMSHSNFYKIIDIIRKNDIKVCYFKYASAEKCAEQLALEEAEDEAPPTDPDA